MDIMEFFKNISENKCVSDPLKIPLCNCGCVHCNQWPSMQTKSTMLIYTELVSIWATNELTMAYFIFNLVTSVKHSVRNANTIHSSFIALLDSILSVGSEKFVNDFVVWIMRIWDVQKVVIWCVIWMIIQIWIFKLLQRTHSSWKMITAPNIWAAPSSVHFVGSEIIKTDSIVCIICIAARHVSYEKRTLRNCEPHEWELII